MNSENGFRLSSSFEDLMDVTEQLVQNEDTISHNGGENSAVPLLSPRDKQTSLKKSLNVPRKSKENVLDIPLIKIKDDKTDSPNKSIDRPYSDVRNRNRQKKIDRQSIPLLTVSSENSDGVNTESIELDPLTEDDTSLTGEIIKPNKIFNDADLLTDQQDETDTPHDDGISHHFYQDTVGSLFKKKTRRGKTSKGLHPELLKLLKAKQNARVVPEPKKELTKLELVKSYRLHIFVAFIFVITALSVSLAWYYKNEAQEKLYASQAIFFNPRTRELTLSDSSKTNTVRGTLAKDIPSWMLPLHCPIIMGNDPHNKECLWKKVAILRVSHFQDNKQVHCYNVSWESLSAQHLPHDCFNVGDSKWYGPSNQSASAFPIQGKFEYKPISYTLNNNGLFNNVVDFYWLSSSGTAIYVNASNPIQVAWNVSGSNQLCFKSNFTGPLYYRSVYNQPVMNYTLCQGLDPMVTHSFMQSMFASKTSIQHPNASLLQVPHFSLSNIMKADIVNQSHVSDLVNTVKDQGFSKSIITLDGHWQKSHGDLVFDPQRFHNVTKMLEDLTSVGSRLTLCISPYFEYMSPNFDAGAKTNIFVKDAGGSVTGLVNFQGGLAAILDFFSFDGTKWFQEKVLNLTKTHQIDTYRLTYGHQSWLPYKPHFNTVDATPNVYRKLFTEQFDAMSNLSLIVEHTADSRHIANLIPVSTDISQDGKCLTGAIEKALTLGLMGYPYIMADGFTVNTELSSNTSDGFTKPSRELYIRWLQLAVLFPAYQYTTAPWEYDNDVVYIAKNLSRVHDIVLEEIKTAELEAEVSLKGLPIMRPVWWLDASNSSLHNLQITDEFLIGNSLLVAPVLCEGVTKRDIYIPPGVWEGLSKAQPLIIGPNIIQNQPVTDDDVIMFRRRPVLGKRQI